MDVLYAFNAKTEPNLNIKKETGRETIPNGSQQSAATITGSAISIANLLDYVNKYFPDILPEEVLKHYGHTSRPEGKIGESALFQDRLDIADRNRAVILQKKAESLEKELAELERAYGEVIRREYEQNIKPQKRFIILSALLRTEKRTAKKLSPCLNFDIYRKEPKGSFFAAIGGKCVSSVQYHLKLRSVSFFPSAFYDIVAKKQPLPYGGGCAHLPYTLYGI